MSVLFTERQSHFMFDDTLLLSNIDPLSMSHTATYVFVD